MAGRDQVDVVDEDVVLGEDDETRANAFLDLFREKRRQGAEPPRRKPPKGKRVKQGSPRLPMMIIISMLVLSLAAVVVIFNAPAISGIAAIVNADNAAPQPANDSPLLDMPLPLVQPEGTMPDEVMVVEPTMNPALTGRKAPKVMVDVAVLAKSFKTQITTQVRPANIGLIHQETGDMVYDAAVTIKYAYGSTSSFEEMNAVMQNSGDYLITEAKNGNKDADALVQTTFKEFQDAVEKGLTEIPAMNKPQLLVKANDMGYYFGGMWALSDSEEDAAKREDLVNQAAQKFAERWNQLEEEEKAKAAPTQKPAEAVAPETSGETNPTAEPNPGDNPAVNPAPADQPNPVPGEDPNADPAKDISADPAKDLFPEAKTEEVTSELTAVAMPELPMTDYSMFPANIAAPLTKWSGWSLNPEGVALAIQQIMALINTGTSGPVNNWIVWNRYNFGGGIWSFVVINKATVEANWSKMPSECQQYMTDMLKDPGQPNIMDLRDRWGQSSCADYVYSPEFNEGMNLLQTTLPSGQPGYLLHKGADGRVDMMGALWYNFGQDLPLMVGSQVKPMSIINLGEGLLKTLFPGLRK